MLAFKVWHDERYYIGNGSNGDKILWTLDQAEAIDEKWLFYNEVLGLDCNQSRANSFKFE